ncbi:MAG: hypothetical protein QOJ64_3758 [Acidobacteriota bacterium]|jgi:hypothetical protein|nr:hypothetical protein [Acidobacteriota bacterium]
METKDPKSTESAGSDPGTETKDPNSAATSDDTLHDLEKTEEVAEKGEREHSAPSAVPSPDGEFGGDGGRKDDAGPM